MLYIRATTLKTKQNFKPLHCMKGNMILSIRSSEKLALYLIFCGTRRGLKPTQNFKAKKKRKERDEDRIVLLL